MSTALQYDICAEVPDLLMCGEDEMIIFLSGQNEWQLTKACLARGLSSVVLEYDNGYHFNDCLIMVCKKNVYREFTGGTIKNIELLRSLSSDVQLLVRSNPKNTHILGHLKQILKFWFRIINIREREVNVAVTFLGFRCGELLCSSLFSLPLQNPQDTFFSRRFGQKIKYTAQWLLFVSSIRSALVTLRHDNSC